MKSFFGSLLGIFGKSWWVEISTAQPHVIYYFGPFETEEEALSYQGGYIEDLEGEGAQDIKVAISRRTDPEELTIEMSQTTAPGMTPAYSNQ
jgi:hypothetical protein